MKLQHRIGRSVARRSRKLQNTQPSVEFVEPRVLMATGFIQGYDLNNGVAINDATIQLENTNPVSYTTTTTNASGYFQFNNLAPGNYVVTPTAAGYISNSVKIQTTVNPANEVVNPDGSIGVDVTVENPASESVKVTNYEFSGGGSLYYQLNSTANNPASEDTITQANNAGAFDATLVDPTTGQADTSIVTYCSDLSNGLSVGQLFTVTPSLTPSLTPQTPGSPATTQPGLATNIGLIGYLYNTYGTTLSPGIPPADTDSPAPTASELACGLQVALWTLEYNQDVGSVTTTTTVSATDPFFVNTTTSSSEVIDAANAYLADAAQAAAHGNSQDLYFLDLDTKTEQNPDADSGQSLMSTDMLTFTSQPTASVSTAIYNAATNQAITGNQPLGTSVYDTAAVTTVTGAPTPSGTLTYYFYNTATPVYGTTTPVGTPQTVSLLPDGSVPNSLPTAPLGAGAESFIGVYNGDSHYAIAVGAVEPLSINKATITLNTTIYNAANNSVVTGALPLGSSVYDTASFTGAVAGFTPDITQVSYTFTSPSGTAGAGSGAQSSTEGPLGAGSYKFDASFAGDANYNLAVSGDEPLSISKATITLNTTIYNAANNSVVTGALPLGSSVYDTASFTGAVAGFTPDITQVSYTFTSPSGTAGAGSGAQSSTEGPLGAGSYKFDASFAGDANYNLAVSGDEPLSISKATITLNTTIYNAANNSVVTGALPLGSSVYDTASFTGGVAGFTPDITQVSYTFTSPSGTAGAGSGAQSSTEGPLGAGSYKFDASFAGDANYNLAVSGDEPLSISKATITLNTTIYNAANNSVVTGALPLGSSVYDTASFTGGVAGFTPDITQVSYTFTSPSGTAGAGSGAQSSTEGPLGAGSYKFDASFAGDANYNLAVSGDEPLSINKATITLNTTIYNAANNSVVTGALPLGSSVYDTASFTGGVAGFTPDITQVSYTFTSPTGTAAAGSGAQSSTEGPLGAGSYKFDASFAGDANYNLAVSGDEPLSINKATITLNTTIYNAANNSVVTGALPLGSSVYDTASFTGGVAGFTPDITQVSYTFTSPTGTAGAGSGAQSSTEGPLGAGSYKFDASFAGDANYNLAVSGDEPLSINKATITLNTTIYNAANNSVVTGALPLGSSVYDTASFTGAVAGFTPAISQVSYTFTSPTGTAGAGSGGQSTTEGPLGAGSYKFDASFAGDANYNLAVSGDEPLSINKATITLNTTIYNAANNSVVTGALPLGSSVYDTASFTGAVAGFTPAISQVSYTFTSPTGTAGAGSGGQSTTEGPLGAGSYKFDASFAGDANYNLAVSGDEPLSINKATITLNTTIYNAANNSVVTGALPLGSSVYDTASFTGAVAGFTPAISQVSYTFTSPTGTAGAGSGGQSTTEGPLGAGSYKFDASFAGDANYNLAVSGDEPLSINKATITLNTTIYNAANNSVVTGALPLGSSVYDTASFTGAVAGFTPAISQVSYTFTSPTGTAGAGSGGQSTTEGPLGAGSYKFDASFAGDANYNLAVSGDEPLTISQGVTGQGVASVNTTIYDSSGGAVTKALGEKVYDTATVTGTPFTPTGTVTYYFYNTASPVYGTTTPVGTPQKVTLGANASVPNSATTAGLTAGSYSFIAYYSGDSNYTGYAGAVEPLTINKGSSNVSTTILDCGGGAVTSALGEKVYDTATVTGTPFTPTGTVTYYFYNTASPVYGTTTPVGTPQKVTLNANGSVPNSATTAALGAGGYSFIGVYSGDSNYNGYQGAIEPLTIGKASPSITTSPNPTVFTIGTSCGPLTDSATISGGSNPGGTITFTLYAPGCNTPVDTETVNVTSGDGTYTTPKGYALPSNPTPGVYQWDATYNGDSNNNKAIDSGNAWEQVEVVSPCCNDVSNVSFSLTNNGKTTTVSDLSGNTQQGETVTANFTVPAGYYDQLTLVTYTAPEGWYNADDANLQVVSSVVTGFFGPGAHTLGPVTIPNSFYQIDFVCGSVITTLGPESTNPNNFYHAQNRFISGDNGGVNPVGSPELQITGTVFADANDDGIQETGDTGLAGVTVTLTGTDAYGNSVSYSTTTNSSGVYTFAGMPFSNSSGYTVTPSVPTGYTAGIATAGKVNGSSDGSASSSPESVGSISMLNNSQTNGVNYNFGMVKPVGSISGEVYNDVNGDGKLENGDTGLAGVTVTLYNSNGVVASTTTNSSGMYSFSNLAPGTYKVVETILNNYLGTGSDVGTVGGTGDGTSVSATTIGSIALSSGQSGINYNFGEDQANCNISGKVFCDNQNNCNSNQAGLGGVTVTCYNSSGTAVCSTTSNSSGGYSFTNLAPGTYCVVQTVLGGYNATGCDIGSAGGNSPSNCKIAGIVASGGGSCTGYDFGQRRS